MADDEKQRLKERSKLESLLARLEPARCWSDETGIGYRSTKWFHLSPADLDLAKEVIRDRILELR